MKQVEISDEDVTLIQSDTGHKKFHGTWYRGPDTNFIPNKAQLRGEDGLARYILSGWMPPEPFIRKSDRVTSFGSCFAEHLTRVLDERGFDVSLKDASVSKSYVIRFGEGLVNTFAIRQQLEWGFGEEVVDDALWFGANKEIAPPDPQVQGETAALLNRTDVFVITLGLSEVWYDKVSGGVFWRAVPADMFDEARHGFKVSTVEENRENLVAIRDVILRHRPDAKLIFTLSPVPLLATFRPVSCLSASSVSKAVLRVALDEFIRGLPEGQTDTWYYPSYEAITQYFPDPFQNDNRHPKPRNVRMVLNHFLRFFCTEDEAVATGG